MKKRIINICLLFYLCFCLLACSSDNSNSDNGDKKYNNSDLAFNHLNEVMDQYHNNFQVYTDFASGGNHFYPSGWMKGSNSDFENIFSHFENYATDCYAGTSCIKVSYSPSAYSDWISLYYFEPDYAQISNSKWSNWGDLPGHNLSGASQLTFWAKADSNQDSKIDFFVGNIRLPKKKIEVALTDQWTQYKIQLNLEVSEFEKLSDLVVGFGYLIDSDQPVTFFLDNIIFNKSINDKLRFLRSYETISSTLEPDNKLSNICFIYDNALVLLAYLARKTPDDLKRAKIIADSFKYALEHDILKDDKDSNFDYWIRNGYMSGDLKDNYKDKARMPGLWSYEDKSFFLDNFCLSTHVGNVAWTMLALITYYEEVKEKIYLDSVERMGNWIEKYTRNDDGFGGYTGGLQIDENGQLTKIQWISTEHNIDCYVSFERLYKLTNNINWHKRAIHALDFVKAMWNPVEKHFWTGSNDGTTENKKDKPLDIHPWAVLALNDYFEGLQWSESNCYIEESGFSGFDFGTDLDGIWYEGTAQMAVAYLVVNENSKSENLIKTIEYAQQNSPNNNCKGIVAASIDGLTTGKEYDWKYFQRLHIGATAWYLFAKYAYNPYWGMTIDKWKEQSNELYKNNIFARK
ncbi:conserved hypothetical protein, secreted [Candidatus Magnetomorum sp. HK-1]|nr:conserved hypothetical protein, secreted [Candidatus Magnetomorum sp. HK-1]